MSTEQRRQHYSYRVYGDPQHAATYDTDRFGGEVGRYIEDAQRRVVFSTLGDVRGWKIIDVGAGTGRFALAFQQAGAEVLAYDASPQMLAVLEDKAARQNIPVRTQVGDAQELVFPDRHFDCAVSFRVLMHVQDWRRALSELCRVSNNWVVFDFAPTHGLMLLAPLFHALGGAIKKDWQSYRTISTGALLADLECHGFDVVGTDPGFAVPLFIHRALSSIGFTRGSEDLCRRLGATKWMGGPLTIFARRRA